MDILNKIDYLRKERGWSLYKLGEEANLSPALLPNMYARKTLPSLPTLINLCEAFNVTLSEFFDDGATASGNKTFELYKTLSKEEQSAVDVIVENLAKNKRK